MCQPAQLLQRVRIQSWAGVHRVGWGRLGSEVSSFPMREPPGRSEEGEDRVGDLPPCVCGRLPRKTAMRESPALGHSVRPRRHSKGVRRSGCPLGSSAASRPPARRRITRSAPRGWPHSPDRFRRAYSLARRVHARAAERCDAPNGTGCPVRRFGTGRKDSSRVIPEARNTWQGAAGAHASKDATTQFTSPGRWLTPQAFARSAVSGLGRHGGQALLGPAGSLGSGSHQRPSCSRSFGKTLRVEPSVMAELKDALELLTDPSCQVFRASGITLDESLRPVPKRRTGHPVPFGASHRSAARGVYPSRQGVSPAEPIG